MQVQCLQWHPYEPELLATGGYDKCVVVQDWVYSSAADSDAILTHYFRIVRLFNCKSPEVCTSWL